MDQQEIFALIVYLIGGDQDKAYDICVDSFARAIATGARDEPEGAFRARLAGIAVEKSRPVQAIPSFDVLDAIDISSQEKNLFRIVLEALQQLDFNAKALVLLRDQLNFSYKDIAVIMSVAQSEVKRSTEQARNLLRSEIEKVLNRS